MTMQARDARDNGEIVTTNSPFFFLLSPPFSSRLSSLISLLQFFSHFLILLLLFLFLSLLTNHIISTQLISSLSLSHLPSHPLHVFKEDLARGPILSSERDRKASGGQVLSSL